MNNEKIENFSNQSFNEDKKGFEKELEFEEIDNFSNQSFEKYIQELEEKIQDPNYRDGISFSLPENPSPIEELKYDLCKKLLIYKREKELDLEEFCERAKISKELAGEILYYHLDYFNLDQVIEAASNVLNLKLEATQSRAKIFPIQKRYSERLTL